jgi:hypothetical protein
MQNALENKDVYENIMGRNNTWVPQSLVKDIFKWILEKN